MSEFQFKHQHEPERRQETRTRVSPSHHEQVRPAAEEVARARAREEAQEAEARHAREEALVAAEQRALEERKFVLCEDLRRLAERKVRERGYLNPPHATPFLEQRTLEELADGDLFGEDRSFVSTAIASLTKEIRDRHAPSYRYLDQVAASLRKPASLLSRAKVMTRRIHGGVHQAQISVRMPAVSDELRQQMEEIEQFLTDDWHSARERGIVAVHVDPASGSTILQLGVAEHGPFYVKIPALLRPESMAHESLRELFRRLVPFGESMDPLVVVDGSHQGLNYNEVFPGLRILRAPSGDTERFARNFRASMRRDRLAPQDTAILNSAPRNADEHRRVFPEDAAARSWPAWSEEAAQWDQAARVEDFAAAPGVSRESVLGALSSAKNVIVVLAHCDGESLFLPDPPPDGSVVTADYLLEHRKEIAANGPLVYLFSCEAGRLDNLRNFASTLLECGASGVVASQSKIGSAEGRSLLGRLLDEGRGRPPIDDLFAAMNDLDYRDMEVFLG